MKIHIIDPNIFVGLQGYHKNTFLKNRTSYTTQEERIIYIISNEFGISVNDILNNSHQRIFSSPIQIAIYFCKKYSIKTLQQLSAIFNRHHSTIIHSINVVNDIIDTNAKFKKHIEKINDLILSD